MSLFSRREKERAPAPPEAPPSPARPEELFDRTVAILGFDPEHTGWFPAPRDPGVLRGDGSLWLRAREVEKR